MQLTKVCSVDLFCFRNPSFLNKRIRQEKSSSFLKGFRELSNPECRVPVLTKYTGRILLVTFVLTLIKVWQLRIGSRTPLQVTMTLLTDPLLPLPLTCFILHPSYPSLSTTYPSVMEIIQQSYRILFKLKIYKLEYSCISYSIFLHVPVTIQVTRGPSKFYFIMVGFYVVLAVGRTVSKRSLQGKRSVTCRSFVQSSLAPLRVEP